MNKPIQTLLTTALLTGCTPDKPEWITPQTETVIMETAQAFHDMGVARDPQAKKATCEELQAELAGIGTRLQAVFNENMPNTDCARINWVAKAGKGRIDRQTIIKTDTGKQNVIKAYGDNDLRWGNGNHATPCAPGETDIHLTWDTSTNMACYDTNIT